jgi:DNA recombination protein RmuC
MTLLYLGILAGFVLVLIALFFLIRVQRKLQKQIENKPPDPSFLLLQQQMQGFQSQMSQSVESSARLLNQQMSLVLQDVRERLKENAEVIEKVHLGLGERLDNAARVVGDVRKSLGGLEEANKKIYEVGKDISSLQEILRAPKLRGGLGEFFLEDMLSQILPRDHFEMQHGFRSGERVDAVVRVGESYVSVDSKFPLENFRRLLDAASEEEQNRARKQFLSDVRKHIDAIASRYILPDEGTYDFALMYIPAENVYYETIIKDSLSDEKSIAEYALLKRVIPVSPATFYAYLQAILLGLKGLKVEEQAKEIIQLLGRLEGDFTKVREDFRLVGRHLSNASSAYQSAEKKLDHFGDKVTSLHDPKLDSGLLEE